MPPMLHVRLRLLRVAFITRTQDMGHKKKHSGTHITWNINGKAAETTATTPNGQPTLSQQPDRAVVDKNRQRIVLLRFSRFSPRFFHYVLRALHFHSTSCLQSRFRKPINAGPYSLGAGWVRSASENHHRLRKRNRHAGGEGRPKGGCGQFPVHR